MARLEVPEEPCRYLLPDEEAALMKQLEQDRSFLKPLVGVALSIGFRQCELIALSKYNVDFTRHRIFVVNPKRARDPRKTKGNQMNADTREILARLSREVKGEHFFVHDRTWLPLTRGVIDQVFRRCCTLPEPMAFGFTTCAIPSAHAWETMM